jgi:O-antigen/teichoic acid export membrane protein
LKLPSLNNINSLQLFQLMRFGGFFITGILLVKLGTPVHQVGIYEKLMFLATLSSYFWVQGLITTLLSNYPDHRRKEVYLFNVFLLISITGILVFSLMKLFKGTIENTLADGTLPGYHYLSIYILFNAPCFLIETIYILKHKPVSLIIYGICTTLITIAVIVVPLWLGYSLESAIAALALWAALRYLWLIRLLLKNVIPEINLSYIKFHLVISAPLIVSFIIAGSAEYIDGMLVSTFFSPDQFAIFRYGARELPLSLLMANALSTSLIPVVRKKLQEGNNYDFVKKESVKLINIVFPVSLLLLLISVPLYSFFFSNSFKESALIFNIYILLAISRTLIPQSIIYAFNGTGALLRISVAEILINIFVSFFLMQKMGLAGIAWGTIAAHFSEKLMMCSYLYRKHRISPFTYIPSQWFVYTALLLLGYFSVSLLY